MENTSDPYFYIQNIRGDVVMLVKSDGDVASIRDYDASGEMLSKAPRDRDPFGFTGGLDAGNGLWKLGARFYDSGRNGFIQQDRYLGDPGDPLSLNRYVYCGLDPVNFVDPTGFNRYHIPDGTTKEGRKAQAAITRENNKLERSLNFLDHIDLGGINFLAEIGKMEIKDFQMTLESCQDASYFSIDAIYLTDSNPLYTITCYDEDGNILDEADLSESQYNFIVSVSEEDEDDGDENGGE